MKMIVTLSITFCVHFALHFDTILRLSITVTLQITVHQRGVGKYLYIECLPSNIRVNCSSGAYRRAHCERQQLEDDDDDIRIKKRPSFCQAWCDVWFLLAQTSE